jgi:hypothetical protein
MSDIETEASARKMEGPVFCPRNEIAKVQAELIAFRDEYLPAFLGRPLLESMPDHTPDFVRAQAMETSHRPSSWWEAIGTLSEALPVANDSTDNTVLRADDFKDFMFEEARPAFSQSAGGIHWRISLFISLEWVHGWCWPPFLERKDNADTQEKDFLAALPQIKPWLLSLAVDDMVLLNALSMVLPFIADVDPPFVKLALVPETWRWLVMANAAVSEEQRRKWLDWIDQAYFRHAINNALLHVFGALANNHFMLIRDYLEHPCLHGSYTGLMPHYLFALLFQKVSILRQFFAGGESMGRDNSCRGAAERLQEE